MGRHGHNVGAMWGQCGGNVGATWGQCGGNVWAMWGMKKLRGNRKCCCKSRVVNSRRMPSMRTLHESFETEMGFPGIIWACATMGNGAFYHLMSHEVSTANEQLHENKNEQMTEQPKV
eukprot:476976-Prorocentrum_minimum.AAC.1